MSSEALPRAKSFEKVNYLLRPKKQIERKIIIDLLRSVKEIHEYLYIGLGSIYYYDFILFHKYLNLTNMISLDDEETKKRFEFNVPYDFISFFNLKTTDYLKEHTFDSKLLIWFDYDSTLCSNKGFRNQSIFEDIEIITRQAKSPTFFFLTVNIRPPSGKDKQDIFRSEFDTFLSDNFKSDRYTISNFLFFRDYPLMIQNALLNFIEETGKLREIKFQKLFSFSYADTAPMYTLGGVYGTKPELASLKTALRHNQFVNGNPRNIFDIDVPILTYKEKIFMDAKIKSLKSRVSAAVGKKDMTDILASLEFELESPEMLRKYLRYGKYYPQYYEGII